MRPAAGRTADVREFRDWLDVAENDLAWSELERRAETIGGRHVVLPSAAGSKVPDTFTGEPAGFAAGPQVDIPFNDACEIAAILNRRAATHESQ